MTAHIDPNLFAGPVAVLENAVRSSTSTTRGWQSMAALTPS
jgi:hypothetical protein